MYFQAVANKNETTYFQPRTNVIETVIQAVAAQDQAAAAQDQTTPVQRLVKTIVDEALQAGIITASQRDQIVALYKS